MKKSFQKLTVVLLILAPAILFIWQAGCGTPSQQPPSRHTRNFGMGGVDIDIPIEDFIALSKSGVSILFPSWGLEQDPEQIRTFLDNANSVGLKVVLDAGYLGAVWGYIGDGPFPDDQTPVLQTDLLIQFIERFRKHPALLGWLISWAAGAHLPNGIDTDAWPESALTIEQLREVADTIRSVDHTHPLIMGMEIEPPDKQEIFDQENPFEAGLVQMVVLGMFSNKSNDGETVEDPQLIADQGARLIDAILGVDPSVSVWMGLAAFASPPEYLAPTVDDLNRDFNSALAIPTLQNIGFYQWGGPQSDFYLPAPEKGLADLWSTIKKLIKAEQG